LALTATQSSEKSRDVLLATLTTLTRKFVLPKFAALQLRPPRVRRAAEEVRLLGGGERRGAAIVQVWLAEPALPAASVASTWKTC
jgi:hypothetical protein